MKYMGSKNKIAKYIIPIIQSYIDENDIKTYIEPFVGGANVIDKISCENRYGSDNNKYLIALLQHVQNGGELYKAVPKDLYDKARTAYNNNDTSDFEDWEIGNIGFLASYNGRFFDGGYAKAGYEGTRLRDYYQECSRNILKQAKDLKNINFEYKDFRDINIKNTLIYCDPPYKNTTQYGKEVFDYDFFWETVKKWSADNIVIVSEQTAPEDWICIWEQQISRTIRAIDKKKPATERLFIYKG